MKYNKTENPYAELVLQQDYQPDMYYYWDSPLEEDYDWRDAIPYADCLCEICFDILNEEGKLKWK